MHRTERRAVAAVLAAVAAAFALVVSALALAEPGYGAGAGVVVELASGELRDLLAGDVHSASLVTVEVLFRGDQSVVERRIEALGGAVTGSVPGVLVQADVPPRSLGAIAAIEGVTMLRPPIQVSIPMDEPAAGDGPVGAAAAIGEEVAKTLAAAWHAAGHTGKGVKIGIVDSFAGSAWTAAQNAGEVPVPAGSFCRLGGTTCGSPIGLSLSAHGVLVAEVIHDVAPDAKLYVASVGTAADLSAAVDYFAANGVTIISRSLGSQYDGPGDGTGPLGAVVDRAVSKGMTWFNAAGNAAGNATRPGAYWRGEWSDADNDGWLDFGLDASGTPLNRVRILCGGFLFGVRWNDWATWAGGSGRATDYDVYVYDTVEAIAANAWESRSTDAQAAAGAPPLELSAQSRCSSPADNEDLLKIRLVTARPDDTDKRDTIELLGNLTAFSISTNPYSAAFPIADSANPGLVAVGAIDPANGTTPAAYSSWGPTNDERLKPDLAAASCVKTFTQPTRCFDGTSAATPTAAAVAALVLGAGLAKTPNELTDWLYAHALADRADAGPDNRTGRGELVLPPPPAKSPTATGAFHSLTPARLYDSRSVAKLAANEVRAVTVLGQRGVPAAGVAAVVVNLTITETEAEGYAVAFPCGGAPPLASNVNYVREQTAANAVKVKVGASGQICVTSYAPAHIVVDVAGWYGTEAADSGSLFHGVTPTRLIDTRTTARVQPNAPITIELRDRAGLPSGAMSSVAMNLTVTGPAGAGYITAYPCGSAPPEASNVNYAAAQTIANFAIVAVGAPQTVCIATFVETDVIVDIAGWYGPLGETQGSAYTALAPERVLDTRPTNSPLLTGFVGTLAVAGRGGLPAQATGTAVVNITAVNPQVDGYVTAYPCGATVPLASNLNFVVGQTVANLAVVTIGTEGRICLSGFTTHVVVDVSGFFD